MGHSTRWKASGQRSGAGSSTQWLAQEEIQPGEGTKKIPRGADGVLCQYGGFSEEPPGPGIQQMLKGQDCDPSWSPEPSSFVGWVPGVQVNGGLQES